jgi:hypothetical protein
MGGNPVRAVDRHWGNDEGSTAGYWAFFGGWAGGHAGAAGWPRASLFGPLDAGQAGQGDSLERPPWPSGRCAKDARTLARNAVVVERGLKSVRIHEPTPWQGSTMPYSPHAQLNPRTARPSADRRAARSLRLGRSGLQIGGSLCRTRRGAARSPTDDRSLRLPATRGSPSRGCDRGKEGGDDALDSCRANDSLCAELARFSGGWGRPETIAEWATQESTLRARLKAMPTAHPLVTQGMRDCQVEAITGLEKSFAENRPRSLIHMATGAGKTFTACAFTYRLIKHAGARRVLFLVDRANLGRQARDEFHKFHTPDTGRLFTELYNVQTRRCQNKMGVIA